MIIDNDIFWNNFNFHEGNPPFEPRDEGTAALVPIGTGILLLGGRGNRIENNRIHGNFLTGVAAIDGHPADREPAGASRSTATSSATTSSASAAPTSTAATSPTTAAAPTTASRSPASTSTFPADRSTFAGLRGAERVQQAAQRRR